MKFTPRYYQSEAEAAAMAWIRKSLDPCLIEAATGAGKSMIIAMLAAAMYAMSGGKHVLCLAPSAELVTQNREKYLLTGEPASIYSASAGQKDLRWPVIFGTPGTVLAAAERIASRICCILVDEAHGMTPTIVAIIKTIRAGNPRVRVIGLTATPYRTGEGYIYRQDEQGKTLSEDLIREPFFMRKVYSIQAHALVAEGYLTAPVVGDIGVAGYDTSEIETAASKRAMDDAIDRAFEGHGRETSMVVADIVHQAAGYRGVMLFAATVQHAEEVFASLPPSISRLITGKTKKKDRDQWNADFKAMKFKYLVSVGTHTTGFDAPHVDLIAILRYTESPGLLQQIIGRGARLFEGKDHFLILDYANNIERHFPDGDVFAPEIKASYAGTSGAPINVECPECSNVNEFSCRKNDEGHAIDKNGYFVDLEGHRVMLDSGNTDEQGERIMLPLPAHYGRRCQGFHNSRGDGHFYQCGYRWSCKPCPHCEAENDIAARYCTSCKGEIINPNDKLCVEFKQRKKDPSQLQTDEVLSAVEVPGVSQKGQPQVRVDFVTPYRNFSIWYRPDAHSGPAQMEWSRYLKATHNREFIPSSVTYRKDTNSGFYRVHDFNLPPDEAPIGYDHSKNLKDYA